jgi:hypothetical protein
MAKAEVVEGMDTMAPAFDAADAPTQAASQSVVARLLRPKSTHGYGKDAARGMWVEAILTQEDLREFLEQMVPVTFRLAEQADLCLDAPFVVSLTPEKGISVACHGKLQWPLFGVNVPATLDSLVLLIRPLVEARDGGHTLVFELQIEHASIAFLPAVINRRLVSRVNEELAKKNLELGWNFGKTLTHLFPLPRSIESAEALTVEVTDGTAKITETAVGFAVAFKTAVRRRAGKTRSLVGSKIVDPPDAT